MSGRIVSGDALSRRVQSIHREDGKVILDTVFDAQDMVDEAAMARQGWNGGYRGTKDWSATRIAVIPLTILFDLRKKGIMQDQKALAKWLNEYSAFKATDGNPIG
jgi:hypothetical protein